MKTKLLKLALCAMAALPMGAWADEISVSTEKTWTFDGLTAGTEYTSITSIDGYYLRTSTSDPDRKFTVTAGEQQTLTFPDKSTVNVTNYLLANGAMQNFNDTYLTVTQTAGNDNLVSNRHAASCSFAFNASVPGTVYVYGTNADANKKVRIVFTDGTHKIVTDKNNPEALALTEVVYTSATSGSFFIGGPESTFRIYAVRFVPIGQTISVATSLTFDHFTNDATLGAVYNMANGFFIRGNGSKYFTVKENEDASKPYSFSDGTSLQANKYVKLNSAIEAHAFNNNDNDQYPWTITGGKTYPSIAFKNTVAGKLLVYAAKASESTATLRYYTKSTGATSTNLAVTTTPTEYSWNVAADEVTYITAGTAAGLHIYGVRFVPVIKTTIGSHGKSSFSCAQGLDFSSATPAGLKAYKAKEVNTSGLVVLSSVDEAPAGTGLILSGEPGTEYTIPVKDDAGSVGTNLMVGTITETAVAASTDDVHNYIWAYTASGLGFYNVATATTSAAGKAYLATGATALNATTPARGFIFEDEDVTGIDVVKGSELKANGEYFNLNGQRVAQPTKGLYIVNGKKVIIK